MTMQAERREVLRCVILAQRCEAAVRNERSQLRPPRNLRPRPRDDAEGGDGKRQRCLAQFTLLQVLADTQGRAQEIQSFPTTHIPLSKTTLPFP
eukprot:CAMPEP_0181328642 /NCGR_PEP_ID=MMETSP1101-20121128/22846_1 /TAXON_ID=46948 /ORGANISM="Rhodomonas abbreviata, Strain Caron Lab Isolate" /LENGTH=93 /DNA_ID=CAMNT_0023437587 /DNA_START=27 /DNA_END=305 /DNA_ORIENTATION=-